MNETLLGHDGDLCSYGISEYKFFRSIYDCHIPEFYSHEYIFSRYARFSDSFSDVHFIIYRFHISVSLFEVGSSTVGVPYPEALDCERGLDTPKLCKYASPLTVSKCLYPTWTGSCYFHVCEGSYLIHMPSTHPDTSVRPCHRSLGHPPTTFSRIFRRSRQKPKRVYMTYPIPTAGILVPLLSVK